MWFNSGYFLIYAEQESGVHIPSFALLHHAEVITSFWHDIYKRDISDIGCALLCLCLNLIDISKNSRIRQNFV